ncbi:MAG TPA: DUF5522 domain-containing protein [Puia sp.]|jgi:hypothetical protein|nr:DUF5522 domain-containing protein [Puia sp.]
MNNQLVEGLDFYYDEQGYIVLTEKYHLEKGFCCGNGCRHCPYQYENVPEPRRSELLEQTGIHGQNKK